jgi:acyl transferase domain-containing protein
MEGVLGKLEAAAKRVRMEAPRLRLISNLSGEVAGREVTEAGYWARHTRETVQFARGMETLRGLGCEVMVEVGPGPVLTGIGQECLGREGRRWVGSLRRGKSDWVQLSQSVQELYAGGVEIDWGGWDRDYGRRKVGLPTYRFQRQRYWIGGMGSGRRGGQREAYVHPLLGVERSTPLAARQYEAELGAGRPEWLEDHRIAGKVVMPATAYVELGLAAGRELWSGTECVVEDVAVPQALVWDGAETLRVITVLEKGDDEQARWRVYSAGKEDGREWTLHASGRVRRQKEIAQLGASDGIDGVRQRCGEPVGGDQFYAQMGAKFGESFRGVRRLWKGEREALAEIHLSERVSSEANRYVMHPALLDSALQFLQQGRLLLDRAEQRLDHFRLILAIVMERRIFGAIGAIGPWAAVELKKCGTPFPALGRSQPRLERDSHGWNKWRSSRRMPPRHDIPCLRTPTRSRRLPNTNPDKSKVVAMKLKNAVEWREIDLAR